MLRKQAAKQYNHLHKLAFFTSLHVHSKTAASQDTVLLCPACTPASVVGKGGESKHARRVDACTHQGTTPLPTYLVSC
jgi:hypothetical protein